MEAVCLSLVGAAAGMALGMAMARLLARLDILEVLFSWKVFLFATGASVCIGLLFGLRPAREAASLPPIEALKAQG
jgi:putative ABC transport system permease protein